MGGHMDKTVVAALEAAGMVPEPLSLRIRLEVQADGGIDLGSTVTVEQEERSVAVALAPIASLWSGSRLPPDLTGKPQKDYIPFFHSIEQAAADYCWQSGRQVIDREFERLYELLRRRPDGRDAEPVFAVLQAGARLYMSLCDTSQAEYEAVVRRLARSARTFAIGGPVSRNYWEIALEPLVPTHGGGRFQ